MITPRQSRNQMRLYFLSVLLWAALSPIIAQGRVVADLPPDDDSAGASHALPAWWRATPSPTGDRPVIQASNGAVLVQWPGTGPSIAQASVDHFDVSAPSFAKAGLAFTTVITALAGDNSPVSVTTTLTLETGDGETIQPTSAEMVAGIATVNVTLTAAGAGKLVKTISGTITGATTININVADTDRLSLTPANATIKAGDVRAYTAIAYDAYDNEIGDVTTSTYFDIDAAAGGIWIDNDYTSEKAGAWTVVGTDTSSGVSGTATLTVEPGDLDHFGLTGYPASTIAGDPFSSPVTVTAYDGFGNVKTDYGGVVQLSSSDISATLPNDYPFVGTDAGIHAFSGAEFILFQAPNQTITVEDIVSAINQSSGPIDVEPADLNHIRINWDTGNGGQANGYPEEVGTHTMNIYGSATVWAGSYDQFHNFREDVEVNWGATGVLTHGVLAPNPGTSTIFTPAPVLSGTGAISATHLPSGQSDETGLFTIQAPRLTISKVDLNDPVAEGDVLRYRITIANVGSAAIPSVVVTETYDSRVAFDWAEPWPDVGDNVWVFDGLAPGESGPQIRVDTEVEGNLEAGTVLTNLVTVGGPHVAQAEFTVTSTVTSTPDYRPLLYVWIDDHRLSVEAGERIEYDIYYINGGNKDAAGTTIVATPPLSEYIASVECSPSWLCEVQPDQVIYDLETVGWGQDGIVNLVVTLNDSLPAGAHAITASVVISTVTPDNPPDGNFDKDVNLIGTQPDLVVKPTYEKIKPWPGKVVTYTLHYENKEPVAATGVVITATSSPHAPFNPDASNACWEENGSGGYRCAIGELAYAEPGEVLFVVTLTETQFTSEMTNLGAVFEIFGDGGSGADANPGDNVFDAFLGVPNLVITWIHVDPKEVFEGGRGDVWVYIRNTGTVTACGLYGGGLCDGFPLDLFFDPDPLPESYPFNGFGDCYKTVQPIEPGGIAGPKFSFVSGGASDGLCDLTEVTDIWAKVDNWQPGLWGFPAKYGFVPENNEDDNIFQYQRPYKQYLPLVVKHYPGP